MSQEKSETFRIEDNMLVYDGPKPRSDRKALEITRAKWKFLLEHLDDQPNDGSTSTCGFCMQNEKCYTCLVREVTSKVSCLETPYSNYAAIVNPLNKPATRAKLKKAIEDIVKFIDKEIAPVVEGNKQ